MILRYAKLKTTMDLDVHSYDADPARLTSLRVVVREHPEETFTPAGFTTPSTLPVGERIELGLWSPFRPETALVVFCSR